MHSYGTAQRRITPDGLALFLQEVISEYASYGSMVRRLDEREYVTIPVKAQLMDEEGQLCGESFHMVTRDVSSSGLGLFHVVAVPLGRIRLILSSPVTKRKLSVTANVEHCTQCGEYFIIGCRFLGVAHAETAQ